MKKFWNNRGASGIVHDCSSYNFGLPLKTCMRFCSVIGMISSILYIIAGTSLITHISQREKATFSSYGSAYTEKTRHVYYKRNAGFFIGIAVVLVLINVVQLVSDALLFHSTLKGSKSKSLWVFFLLDVILWILTLICFVTIFSGGGLFLLLVFLLGTAIRAYIVFVLHEFMGEESKVHGVVDCEDPPQIIEKTSRPSSYKKSEGEEITGVSIDNNNTNKDRDAVDKDAINNEEEGHSYKDIVMKDIKDEKSERDPGDSTDVTEIPSRLYDKEDIKDKDKEIAGENPTHQSNIKENN